MIDLQQRLRHCFNTLVIILLCSCSESPEEKSAQSYMDEIRDVLQKLRSLDVEVKKLVGKSNTVDSHIIVPKIEQEFLPIINDLSERISVIVPAPRLHSTHELMARYLSLRREAYTAAIDGYRQQDPELMSKFSTLQIEADRVGHDLSNELSRIRRPNPH